MDIRSKNAMVMTCVFIALLAVSLGVRKFVLAPSFQALEREEALTNGDRCVQAVNREIEHLNSVCLEWSDWNDLYEYVENQDQAFYDANLGSKEYFRTANLPVMCILDAEDRVVWSSVLDLDRLEPIEIQAFPRDAFPAGHPLTTTSHPEGYINGILLTEHGPMLAASRPIRTTDSQGAARGRFIIARFLNDKTIEALREQTDVEFTIWSTREPLPSRVPADFATALPQDLIRTSSDSLAVYHTIPCLTRGDSLVLEATMPRAITRRGNEATSAAFLTLAGGGACVLIVLMVALQRMVIRPLALLTQHAQRVGSTGDLTARLAMVRTDEIGTLAKAFDDMTERLSRAQTSLADASRNAGKAEVAAGVLHNVGNVLNSVVISVHGVRQAITKSSAAALTKVADLIQTHQQNLPRFLESDPKGRQLPEYIVKLSEAVRLEQHELTRDVNRLAESIGQITDIIQSQQRNAGDAEVLERVDVVEVVRNAASVLQPSCERHGIALELDAPRPIHTLADRSRLQQIFVNVLTNAMQAVKGVATDQRTISVRVGGDQDEYWFEVRDQGVGFEPEVHAQLFRQGFTTRKDGQGFGLHYCAIAARQMGGSITAESGGTGKGATFRFRGPIRQNDSRMAA
ncbi:MAG: HAMP domain-containing protein [Phycisphaerae bacterium]|nr:HAMP domain-containing protein [Phycisphaerae bacterium]